MAGRPSLALCRSALVLVLVLVLLGPAAAAAAAHGSGHAQTEAAEGVPCAALYAALLCCSVDEARGCAPNRTAAELCFARPGVACDGRTHYPSGNSSGNASAVVCGGVSYAAQDSVFTKVWGRRGQRWRKTAEDGGRRRFSLSFFLLRSGWVRAGAA